MAKNDPHAEIHESAEKESKAGESNAQREVNESRKIHNKLGLPGGRDHDEVDKIFGTPQITDDSQEVSKPCDDPAAVNQRKADIEKKYGVTFDTKDTLPEAERARFREPSLAELQVLDNALAKSRETAEGTSLSKPLHITFLTKDANDPYLAVHGPINDKKTRLTVHNDDLALTDDDRKTGKVSLGSVLMHELGHRSDCVLRRDDSKLGWKDLGGDKFAIETKDGQLYKWVSDKDSTDGKEHWQKVDSTGANIDGQPDSQVDDKQMQTMAKVPQPMDPANDPAESFANAIRMYRQNAETREELKEKSPEIYKYMQEYDEQRLRGMGTDFWGAPNYKRDENGVVVKNEKSWQGFNPALMNTSAAA
jgi:hypothetical protein